MLKVTIIIIVAVILMGIYEIGCSVGYNKRRNKVVSNDINRITDIINNMDDNDLRNEHINFYQEHNIIKSI